jgi:hypothetical protein
LLAAPTSVLASDGTTVVLANVSSGVFKSTDGGITWTLCSQPSAAVVYMGNVWNFQAYSSTDLSTFNAGFLAYSGAFLYSQSDYAISLSLTNANYKQPNSSAVSQAVNGPAYNQSAFTATFKIGVVRGATALVPQTISNAFAPNLLNEKPLYSYDTATTFFVPPSSAGGGQTAYIYAGA